MLQEYSTYLNFARKKGIVQWLMKGWDEDGDGQASTSANSIGQHHYALIDTYKVFILILLQENVRR